MKSYDFIVVGGGPAGATAAKYLARANFSVLLLQRNNNFKKPCGGGIRIDAFDEFELDTAIIRHHIDSITIGFKQKRVAIDISKTPLGIVDRREFDAYLRDEAKKAGADVQEATFSSVDYENDHLLVNFSKNGEHTRCKASYLIAADGVNSKIRKQICNEEVHAGMTNYIDTQNYKTTACEFYFGSDIAANFYAWAFPEAGGGSDVGTLVMGDKPYIHNFLNYLGIEKDSKIKGYKIPIYTKPVFYTKRVFFVGDAAEQVLPFTFEGIYYAMSSAKILAQSISQTNDPNEYERRWKIQYQKKFDILKRLQKIFLWNDFMISVAMHYFESKTIQQKIIKLWMSNEPIQLDAKFYIRLLKRIFRL